MSSPFTMQLALGISEKRMTTSNNEGWFAMTTLERIFLSDSLFSTVSRMAPEISAILTKILKYWWLNLRTKILNFLSLNPVMMWIMGKRSIVRIRLQMPKKAKQKSCHLLSLLHVDGAEKSNGLFCSGVEVVAQHLELR